jgi:hypothetical protein
MAEGHPLKDGPHRFTPENRTQSPKPYREPRQLAQLRSLSL